MNIAHQIVHAANMHIARTSSVLAEEIERERWQITLFKVEAASTGIRLPLSRIINHLAIVRERASFASSRTKKQAQN